MSDRCPRRGPGERWALDKRGHRYNIDELGDKIVPGSTRPPRFPGDKWKNLSHKGRTDVMEKYASAPIMTGPIDPDEAEGPRVLGASSGHVLPLEDVVEFIEPLPPVQEGDGYGGS